jgi:hypothetical protein
MFYRRLLRLAFLTMARRALTSRLYGQGRRALRRYELGALAGALSIPCACIVTYRMPLELSYVDQHNVTRVKTRPK